MLKLVGVDSAGKNSELFFDNKTFSFYIAEYDIHSVITKHAVENKSMQAIIPLGYGCNNNCVYCIQKGMKDTLFNPWKLTSSILSYNNKISSIHFLGGEPLKRFDILQHIVRLFPKMKYSIVTNGLYLDTEITKFLIDHNFTVAISHDGLSHNLSRGDCIFASSKHEYVKELANHIPTQIASILLNCTDNLYDRYTYFNEMNIPFSFIDINTVLPYTSSLNKLVRGVNNWTEYMSETIHDINRIDAIDDNHTCGDHELVYKMYNLAHTEIKYNINESACPIFNNDIITISIDGNEVYCYNKLENRNKETTDHILSSMNVHKDRCYNCPLLLVCMSGCHISEPEQFDHICNRSFYRKISYFHHFVKQLLGFDIYYIEGAMHHGTSNRFTIKA